MALRIESVVRRGAEVSISVNGTPVPAYAGEMLAGALFAAGIRHLRASPGVGGPRGMFCLMGACQECLVRVDGELALSCQEPVRAGMAVTIEAAP